MKPLKSSNDQTPCLSEQIFSRQISSRQIFSRQIFSRQIFSVLTLSLLILSVGCAESGFIDETDQEEKVIGGAVEEGELATVAIIGAGLCTGTVIAPSVVLTAAHCVASLSGDRRTISLHQLDEVIVTRGSELVERVGISGAVFHDSWNDSNLYAGVDIALVYLSRPLSVTPVPLDLTPHAQRVGQVGKIVGFGRSDVSDPNASGVKMSVNLRVNQVVNGTLYHLVSPDAQHRSSCNGDSGGPFFFGTGGQRVVSGITSFGPAGCISDDSYYVAVYPYLSWINANLNQPTSGVTQVAKRYGDLSCAQYLECQSRCSDGICYEECGESTSYDGHFLWNDFTECAQRTTCDTLTCAAQGPCENQYSMCAEHGTSAQSQPTPTPDPAQPGAQDPSQPGTGAQGSASCSDVFWCLNECESQECLTECYERGTAEAQRQVVELDDCLSQAPCSEGDNQCFINACYSSIASCIPEVLDNSGSGSSSGSGSGSTGAQGARSCVEVVNCINDCAATDEACINDCYSSGTVAAQNAYYDLAVCANNSGCTDSSCVEAMCSGEINQCYSS